MRQPEDEQLDGGFTLIELLVVMAILGVLAAIAIPSFLSQADRGYQANIKSDLKHASIAEDAYATETQGAFTSQLADLLANGYVISPPVIVSAKTYTVVSGPDAYCLTGTSPKTSAVFYYDSQLGVVTKTKPATC